MEMVAVELTKLYFELNKDVFTYKDKIIEVYLAFLKELNK